VRTSEKVNMRDPNSALTREMVERNYGSVIDLGPCAVSANLNLWTLRGSAPLDRISIISSPDVYDPETNIGGTQRPLERKRTVELLDYALGSDMDQELPRAFPEVLLNVRDRSAIQVYDLSDPKRSLDFDSWEGIRPDEEARVVGVRIPVQVLQFPKPEISPQISRVDGNHRLSGMDQAVLEYLKSDEPSRAPNVTFSLFVGLTTEEERRLFNVVNSKQKAVEAALLETQSYNLLTDEQRILPKNMASHLAYILSHDGGAFDEVIFSGGSKVGSKRRGLKHILKVNTLRTTADYQLKSLPSTWRARLLEDPAMLSALVNNYWLAIKYLFPEAWDDKKNYILMQTIGLTALAKLWGESIVVDVLNNSAHKGKQVQDFVPYLDPIRERGLLRKDYRDGKNQLPYDGIAGIAGADKVLRVLSSVLTDLDITIARAKAAHSPDVPLSAKLEPPE
jgi:DGQHR domain-containing protein